MGEVVTSIGRSLGAVIENRAQRVERGQADAVHHIFVAGKREMEDRGDRDGVVQALRGAWRGAPARNPVLEGSNVNRDAGEAGQRYGTA